jgi:hypothetical protein
MARSASIDTCSGTTKVAAISPRHELVSTTEDAFKERLAAIPSAEMVGRSRLMGIETKDCDRSDAIAIEPRCGYTRDPHAK